MGSSGECGTFLRLLSRILSSQRLDIAQHRSPCELKLFDQFVAGHPLSALKQQEDPKESGSPHESNLTEDVTLVSAVWKHVKRGACPCQPSKPVR